MGIVSRFFRDPQQVLNPNPVDRFNSEAQFIHQENAAQRTHEFNMAAQSFDHQTQLNDQTHNNNLSMLNTLNDQGNSVSFHPTGLISNFTPGSGTTSQDTPQPTPQSRTAAAKEGAQSVMPKGTLGGLL